MDAKDLSALSDQEIMARLKTAPRKTLVDGFEVLVTRYKNRIVSFLYRYVGNYRTAEDLAQETFLRVFRKVGDYNNTSKFSTWLYTIASNLAKDEFKRRVRHPAGSLDWQAGQGADTTRNIPTVKGGGASPDQTLEREEKRDAVYRALQALSEEEREILLLKDLQGLSYEDIAGILGLPMGTTKSRIARARMAFKEVWKQVGT